MPTRELRMIFYLWCIYDGNRIAVPEALRHAGICLSLACNSISNVDRHFRHPAKHLQLQAMYPNGEDDCLHLESRQGSYAKHLPPTFHCPRTSSQHTNNPCRYNLLLVVGNAGFILMRILNFTVKQPYFACWLSEYRRSLSRITLQLSLRLILAICLSLAYRRYYIGRDC